MILNPPPLDVQTFNESSNEVFCGRAEERGDFHLRKRKLLNPSKPL